MKCLVICSEADTNIIKELLNTLPIINKCLIKHNFSAGLEVLREFSPDICLLDLDIVTETEREFFKIGSSSTFPIISFSKDPMDAVQGYSSGILTDFILKPLNRERVVMAINRALSVHISNTGLRVSDHIFLKTGRIFKKFNLNEIIYIEAYGIYSKLYTEAGKFLVNDTISKIEIKLMMQDFIRVHKSYIINTNKITSFGAAYFEVNDKKIPIGVSYKAKLSGLLSMLSKAFDTSELELEHA